MTITQGQAIAAVRASLDEPTSTYWSDTDLRRWINDTARDMARRTESLRGTYLQPVVVGTSSYTPLFTSTTQVHRIYRVEYIPTGSTYTYPLEYRDPNSADEIWGLSQSREGTPAIWTSWGAPPTLNVQIFPSPSLAGDLKLWYYRQATSLAITTNADANEDIDIVDGWEDVLIEGVEYRAKRRDNDSSWQEAKQEYEQHLDAMMESTLRFTDAAQMVVTPSGLGIPGWLAGDGWDW